MFSGDPEQVKAQLADIAARAEKRAEQFTSVRQQMESATITEKEPDGSVEATVRASGALVELKLSDRVRNMQPSQIATRVSRTIQKAQSRIGERAQEIISANGVDGDPATKTILDRFAGQYPVPTEESSSSSAPFGTRGGHPERPKRDAQSRFLEPDLDDVDWRPGPDTRRG